MLEQIKLALRIKSDVFDTELNLYINSCKNDLILGGANGEKLLVEDDSFIATVIAYCKWQLNFQSEGERWGKIYQTLKTSLVLDSRYH